MNAFAIRETLLNDLTAAVVFVVSGLFVVAQLALLVR